MDEPDITINGQHLTVGQAMAVRVAIENLAGEVAHGRSLGEDLHGRLMQKGYGDRLNEVRRMIFRPALY